MSVFTVVERRELEAFLGAYDLGALVDYAGIEAGIENTNYFVSTASGEFVLTLFEATPAADLGYFLGLMAHLAESNVVSAHPIADHSGAYLRELAGRPAALVVRLPGHSVERPGRRHCAAIGSAMAHMHLAGGRFDGYRADDRGPTWRRAVAAELRPRLTATQAALIDRVLAEQPLAPALPSGVIHGDLFRDNALFEHGRLTGIIDFYYAHNGPLVYDLAVTVADWCFLPQGLDPVRAGVLLEAYHRVRPLTASERGAWSAAIRAAGARFWLSRLKDELFPRAAALGRIKDPEPFRRVLLAGLEQADALDAAWSGIDTVPERSAD